jgi:hypothetical protein
VKTGITWVAALTGILLGGCASDPLTLQAVGPITSSKSPRGGVGSLQVFTALTERNDAGIQYLYPQNYLIYQMNTPVKSVVNSALMSEQPSVVDLPPGEYVVRAPADGFGWVQVPVLIKAGYLTEVHLDRRWRPGDWRSATNLATMPDGSPMGAKPPESQPKRR